MSGSTTHNDKHSQSVNSDGMRLQVLIPGKQPNTLRPHIIVCGIAWKFSALKSAEARLKCTDEAQPLQSESVAK